MNKDDARKYLTFSLVLLCTLAAGVWGYFYLKDLVAREPANIEQHVEPAP